MLAHDTGLAPHIYKGVCSLVVCKPRVRQGAEIGDCIVGFQPTKYAKGHAIVSYLMKVTAKLPFEEYCKKYLGKRRDVLYRYGAGKDGVWIDNGLSDHGDGSPREVEQQRDESGRYALLSTDYVHFGREGRNLKTELAEFCANGHVDQIVAELAYLRRGQKKVCSQEAADAFLAWVEGLQKGGNPPQHHWAYPTANRVEAITAPGCGQKTARPARKT